MRDILCIAEPDDRKWWDDTITAATLDKLVVMTMIRKTSVVRTCMLAASGGAEHDAIVETLLVAAVVAFHPAIEVKEVVVLRRAVYT